MYEIMESLRQEPLVEKVKHSHSHPFMEPETITQSSTRKTICRQSVKDSHMSHGSVQDQDIVSLADSDASDSEDKAQRSGNKRKSLPQKDRAIKRNK